MRSASVASLPPHSCSSIDSVCTSPSHPNAATDTAAEAFPGKPANIIEKMLEGKLAKFYEEFCLLDQPFIRKPRRPSAHLIASKVAKLGENISVRRFARFKVGAPDWTVAQAKAAGTEEASA